MAMIDEPQYSASVLIDDFGNEDIQRRLNSIRHLSTIARALGEERTRKELIQFLSRQNDIGDEVLLAMAEELGVFIPYVGGVEYAHVLLRPLETLCTEEDTCVGDKAVESLCRIGAQMKDTDLVDWFIPLVKRLAAGEWFTARVSSCGLFHIAYPSAPDTLKTELRSIYSQLCQDDMPTVRRSTASNLGKFAATVEASHLKTDFIPIFEDLAMDDLDSVRLLAVEGCAALGKLLEPQDCVAHILPVIVNLSQDKSWRIRCMVANQLYDLCEAVGPEPTRADLVPAYVRLLRDNETEVRIAAAGKVIKFCRILNPRLAVQHILPCVKELSADSSEHVRSALASAIMGMAPVLGKDATIEQLLPIFLSLLKDEFPDVRLNIISKLDQVNQIPKEDVEPHIPKEDEELEKQYSEIKKNHSHQQSNARSESIENYLTIELERNTHKRFSHEELMKFTSGFAVRVGRGGFGSVYRGKFLNGTEIVVKVLKENDFVEETFLAEVSTMFKTCHRYLVKCYGYCFDPTMKALVYEYMENGSLDALLYGNPRKLEWKTFYKIAIKTAKGLSYLHDGCDNQIIHHDLKPANVLIDKHLCVKITDFGVARIMINSADHVTWTKLRGTPGYIAPEMIMPDSKITCKCDVYSFGMMLFEVLGMRSNGGGLDWFPRKVWSKFESGELDQIIDDCGIHKEKYRVRAKVVSKVALWCAQHTPQARPSMSTVVKMLEGEIPVTEPPNPFYPAPEWSYIKFSPSPFLG